MKKLVLTIAVVLLGLAVNAQQSGYVTVENQNGSKSYEKIRVNAQQSLPFVYQGDTLGYVTLENQNEYNEFNEIIIDKRISDSLFNEIKDLYVTYYVTYSFNIQKEDKNAKIRRQIMVMDSQNINDYSSGVYLIQSGKLRNGSIAVVLALAGVSLLTPLPVVAYLIGGGISLGLQIVSNNKLIKAGLTSKK